ncbi:FabD lysophospholipase-like protein, partial [Ceratobasidium sp. AG-I]
GGGIRALSALVIAKIQMEKLQCQLKLSETPRPCDWYDLIAGSGTGGLLAIMLGRLRMSIDDAIKWYLVIVEEVFSKKKWVGGVGALRASKLEDVLGRMALEYTGDARARMLESNPMQGKCKTFVCAMSAYNMNALIPTLLRSYNIGDNQGPDCTIVEAARATTACAGLFKPVFILQDGVMVPYVDSGLGRNNPTAPMLVEAERLFPGTHVACIVSIGTGHPETISMPVRTDVFQRFLSPDMVQTLKSIASDCEATAHEMARRFQHVDGVYFRFSVDQGMQSIGLSDWEKISEVVVHTRQYAQAIEVTSHLNRAVVAIKSGKAMVPVEQLSECVSKPVKKRSGAVRCPPPSRAFTGRVDIINHMRAYFSTDCQTQRLFVLHGLGGAGKTQLALSFIHRHKHFFSDIFYVDATSRDTIAAGLKELAIYVEAGDTQQHALKWLASQEDQWMLLYNNADNPEINLHEYFPICAHGNILITTRNQQMIAHTRGSGAECLVSSMLPDDAERLLLKTSGVQDSQEAKETAAILTKVSRSYTRVFRECLRKTLAFWLSCTRHCAGWNIHLHHAVRT